MIMPSACNLQLFKNLILINLIISVVQINKLTLGVCNNPQKIHGPQLSTLGFVHGLRMPSLCVIYIFCTTEVLNNDTMN